MTQHKFHVGQRVYLTGGPNGDRKIPGEVVEGPDGDGDFRVRIDGPHGVYDGDAFDGWGAGKCWCFRPDGQLYGSDCHIIPADPDYAAQWEAVQAFAKKRGVEVPDLPEPEDPDLVGLREAIAVAYEGEGWLNTAKMWRNCECDNNHVMTAALAYVKKVRAEYEGEG